MTLGRWAAAGMAVATLVAGCTGADPDPAAPSGPSRAPASEPAATLLRDPALAAAEDPATLRAAALRELDVPAPWRERMRRDLDDWPVHVGEATIGPAGRVELDLVVAAPADADGQLVLRWLPAAEALGDAVEAVEVTVAGQEATVTEDRRGARLVVPVPTDTPTTLRVRARYTVPPRDAIEDDGSPAATGLLARTPGVVALGHWLPLVALASDDGPMVARGDVGAFPVGAFAIRVHHEGTLVAGGREVPCPDEEGCTWVRGAGLRDASAVVLEDGTSARTAAGPVRAVVHAPTGTDPAATVEPVATEAADGLAVLAEALGPLAWEEVDVVAVPVAPGALGMEFPGMVWIDPGAWPDGEPGLGGYVLAHELGHQWFHALVGNGSLSAPVVDESVAQYLSVVVFDALFGTGAGEELARSHLGGRHERAVADGVPDEAPARPLADFSSDRAYGAAVYGAAGQAWVDAEAAVGRGPLLAALRELVGRHGLREVDEDDVLDLLAGASPTAEAIVRRAWGR